MSGLLDLLKGKKTYLAAAGFGLLAVYSFYEGDYVKAREYALAALAVFGLRNAIS